MKNRHFILIIIVVVLLGFLLLWYASRPKQDRMVKVKPPVQSADSGATLAQRDVTLYFASEDGSHLVSEMRQISCSGEEDCVRSTLEALISGPVQEGMRVLPPQTRVLDVGIEDGTAVLDFSPEISTGHPGGSQSELLTVYSLANSVAVNFSHLRQVTIRIDGKAVDTLKGHVDLRLPLIADFTYARETAPTIPDNPPTTDQADGKVR